MFFRSDNANGARPEILDALKNANEGSTQGYGDDAYTRRAAAMIAERFEAPDARVYFVTTGTAANALALSILAPPWGVIFCHESAHINNHECGAPEFFTNGAKLIALGGENGKISPEELQNSIDKNTREGVQRSQPSTLNLTNLTDLGSVYSADETASLCKKASENNLNIHLDGARIANALITTGTIPAELSWKTGVDVLVLGGTKNGLLAGEAVVIFNEALAWEFELRRKRAGHLLSKGRFFGAQFSAYIENDRWLKWAEHSNRKMRALHAALENNSAARFDTPPDGNVAFLSFPREIHRELFKAGAEYYLMPAGQSLEGPGDEYLRARLVTSWSTSDEDIAEFAKYFG